MSYETQYDHEEAEIYAAHERGEISDAQMRKELNELRRDYQDAARESAQDAYDAELERW